MTRLLPRAAYSISIILSCIPLCLSLLTFSNSRLFFLPSLLYIFSSILPPLSSPLLYHCLLVWGWPPINFYFLSSFCNQVVVHLRSAHSYWPVPLTKEVAPPQRASVAPTVPVVSDTEQPHADPVQAPASSPTSAVPTPSTATAPALAAAVTAAPQLVTQPPSADVNAAASRTGSAPAYLHGPLEKDQAAGRLVCKCTTGT